MSLRAVESIARHLPRSLREQVIGYAHSVSAAFPDISLEARIPIRTDLHDQLVFIAGVKRIYSLLRADYWIVENALKLLKQDGIVEFQIGSQVLGSASAEHRDILKLYHELQTYLEEERIWGYVQMSSYREILEALASERSSR